VQLEREGSLSSRVSLGALDCVSVPTVNLRGNGQTKVPEVRCIVLLFVRPETAAFFLSNRAIGSHFSSEGRGSEEVAEMVTY